MMTDRIDEYTPRTGHPLTVFQRMQIGLLMLLVTACGALCAAAWQVVDAYTDRESEHDRELQEFHASLVGELRRLSENAGILTSADLCPVRFRLRYGDQWNHPAREVHSLLTRLDEPIQPTGVPISADGVVNFGLVPPGRYRLELQNQDDYRLAHEFDVVAGVPVDRLVLCPNRMQTPHLTTRIDPEASGAPGERGVVTLFFIERDDVTVGEWTWQPNYREGVWVAGTWGRQDTAGEVGEPPIDDARFGEVLPAVPYRAARCTAMAVFQDRTGAELLFLGTFRFQRGAGDDSAEEAWPDPVFVIEAPPPRYLRSIHEHAAVWSLELPPAMTREMDSRRAREFWAVRQDEEHR
jgi:hypothetical protein